jgi:hypothetical protein
LGRLLVEFDELLEVVEAGLGGGFGFGEEILGAVGEFAGEAAVAGLVRKEGLVRAVAGFAGEGEGVLAFGLQRRVEAEQVPVAGLDRRFHFVLAVVHAAFDEGKFGWLGEMMMPSLPKSMLPEWIRSLPPH